MTHAGADPQLKVVEFPLASSVQDENRLSPDLVMISDPEGIQAEAIRQLRTRLISQHTDLGRHSLTLCSPQANSGCSSVAANLAISFAQIGLNVLIVNADLRQEGLDSLFGETGERPGLLQYLSAGDDDAGRLGVYDVAPNLSLVPSGGTAANAQELLSGDRFSAFLNNTLRQFDLTIIDTPPTDNFADAQRVAAMSGYCAIVARANKTYYASVGELARQLRNDRVEVVGTILNQY